MQPALTDCPPLHVLEDVARGVANDDDADAHVQTCPDCRSQIEEIARNNTLMDELSATMRSRVARPADCLFPTVRGYEIQQCIGHGGQGAIFRAIQTATKRRVAIKLLLGGRFATRHQRNRFEREVELAAGLRHPNIVTVFDRGTTEDGRQFYVMEYVEGATLSSMMTDGGAGGWRESAIASRLQLFAKICLGVAHAHRHGVIHRDLKPANILVDSAHEPRIVDFGLAKMSDLLEGVSAPTVTQAGEFAGTFMYASPEQTLAKPDLIDTRTDVYSLGVILFEMLTGRLPYTTSGPPAQVLQTIAESPPHRPSDFRADVNDEIDTIVLKALSKELVRRYQSAGELLADLERYQSGRPIEAKRDSTWYVIRKTAHRHRLAVGAAATVFLLLAAFAASMVFVARHLSQERDIARREQNRADHNYSLLARALREGNVERGRALCRAGKIAAAEELLWPEYLRPVEDDADRSMRAAAHWALRELYSRSPCILRRDCGFPSRVSMFVTEDGRHAVLSSCGTNDFTLLELPSFQETRGRLELPAGVNSHNAVLSPDGAYVAAGCSDNAVRVWEATTGKCSLTHALGRFLDSTRFSPDGSSIVACGNDETLWILSASSAGNPRALRGHTQNVRFADFSPSGEMIASTGHDKTIRLWDVQTGKSRLIHTDKSRVMWHLDFSPDGGVLTGCGGELDVAIWRISDGHLLRSIESLPGPSPGQMQIRPDGQAVAFTSGADIEMWDIKSGSRIRALIGHTASVSNMHFFSDGEMLLSSDSESIRAWELALDPDRRFLDGHSDSVLSVCSSVDGSMIASGSTDHTVRLWDSKSYKVFRTLSLDSIVQSIALSCRGQLATATQSNSVTLWNSESGAIEGVLLNIDSRVGTLAFSPDGGRLYTVSNKGTLQEWDTRTHECMRTIATNLGLISRLRVSGDGRLLAAGCKGPNAILLWDVKSGEPLESLNGHKGVVRSLHFSASCQLLASCSDDGTVRLWDLKEMRCRATMTGSQERIYGVCFSPDESLLASCDDGGEVGIWDVATGRGLATFTGSKDALFGVSFSSDSSELIYWGEKGILVVQDLQYFDHHIEGNRGYWIQRLSSDAATPSPP